jgi:hypothetical protein
VSAERVKQQPTEGLALSRRELSDAAKDLRKAFDLGRWGRSLAESLRRHLFVWMSFAALVGWVLSRLPAKKQKVYVLPVGKSHQNQVRKTSWPGKQNQGKGTPNLLSLVLPLLTAVGIPLLKREVSSWRSKLFTKREHLAPQRRDRGKSEAEEPARSHAFGCSWVGMHREEKNWQSPAATLGRHIDCARSCLRFAPASQTQPLAVR